MGESDDLFGNGEEHDADESEFERHGRAVHELIQDYLDEHEIEQRARHNHLCQCTGCCGWI